MNRRNRELVYQNWNRMVQATAEGKNDTLKLQEVENALTVAAFTAWVHDGATVKAIWEKKMAFEDLSDHVTQLKTEAKETKVKPEPIGLVKKTKNGKNQLPKMQRQIQKMPQESL